MPAIVLQRYLLAATGANVIVPPSGTIGFNAVTAKVPLGSHWTIRMRGVAGSAVSVDAAGELQISAMEIVWSLFDINGNFLFFWPITLSVITPPATLPPFVNGAFRQYADADQTVSSLDQVGGVAVTVQAQTTMIAHNLDAANPHTGFAQIAAILEFESAGSNE